MDNNKLDAMLRQFASEQYIPSDTLVRRTKATIRGRRLFQGVVFLSLCMQLITVGLIIYVLTSPEVQPVAKIFGGISLFAYLGCLIVVAVAARDKVIWFFKKMEQLIA
jgi:uncharacterized BrkB/YihY/UPF0761 family membrane protein